MNKYFIPIINFDVLNYVKHIYSIKSKKMYEIYRITIYNGNKDVKVYYCDDDKTIDYFLIPIEKIHLYLAVCEIDIKNEKIDLKI